MRVIWTLAAKQDRRDIWDYISTENPYAAIEMDNLFSEAASRLGDYPNSGQVGEIFGTRELIPHENYRLVYEIYGDTVWILTLVHTARHWPPVQK